MQIPVILRPGESGWIIASAPTLPGCHSQGRTRDEALANIREAIELFLEDEHSLEDAGLTTHNYEFIELSIGT
ncbi:MAG: type II toxin-antitoxin system HicB family antitoxin [bacterium]|nr:type II toxin-antitoxin system HicB family antitoxin [bacterium]